MARLKLSFEICVAFSHAKISVRVTVVGQHVSFCIFPLPIRQFQTILASRMGLSSISNIFRTLIESLDSKVFTFFFYSNVIFKIPFLKTFLLSMKKNQKCKFWSAFAAIRLLENDVIQKVVFKIKGDLNTWVQYLGLCKRKFYLL